MHQDRAGAFGQGVSAVIWRMFAEAHLYVEGSEIDSQYRYIPANSEHSPERSKEGAGFKLFLGVGVNDLAVTDQYHFIGRVGNDR